MPNKEEFITAVDKRLDLRLIASGLVMFILLSVFSYIATGLPFIFKPGEKDKLDKIATATEEIKKTISPYEYKETLGKVVILENFENSILNQKPTRWYKVNFRAYGVFKQGYLYIKVSVDGKAFTSNEDVYAKLSATVMPVHQYREFGGHLIGDKGLPTPKSSEFTEMLFDLGDIKYKENYLKSDIEIISADWLKLLNEGSSQKILGFTSTVNQGRIIELSIYYQCEKDNNCSIDQISSD